MNAGLSSLNVGGAVADPAWHTQQAFRAVLDAMSHPGRIVALPQASAADIAAPLYRCGAPLAPGLALLMFTLLDRDTSVRLHGCIDSEEVRRWLRLRTGVRAVPGAAAFEVVAADELDVLACAGFEVGSDVAPQTGATLLIEVAAFDDGASTPLVLRGPGIADACTLRVSGVAGAVWDWRLSLRDQYPCGVEIVLVCGDRVAALPRSTRIAQSTQSTHSTQSASDEPGSRRTVIR